MKKLIDGKNQIQRLSLIRKQIKLLQTQEILLSAKVLKHIEQYGSMKLEYWSAILDMLEKRCPKWKEEYIAECGLRKADEVIQNTSISVCKKVRILYRGVKVA